VTSGGNSFNDFTENQQTKFSRCLKTRAKILCITLRGGALPSALPSP